MSNSVIERLIKSLSRIIKFILPPSIVRDEIKGVYDKGVQDIELKLNINLNGNPEKLGFIENYTFDNVKGMSEELADSLRKTLSQGILNNEPMSKIKKRVQETMDIGKVRASVITRTELNRAANAGRFDAGLQAEAGGIPVKKWLLITDDTRTSMISFALGRKYGSPKQAIPMNQNFKVTVNGKSIEAPHPPFHPNERDRLMIEVQDE